MGKSIRSKIKKRLRTAKRQRVDAMVLTPQLKEHHESLKRVMEGRSVTLKTPKNAFKYPETDGAAFPQHEIIKPIDFRSDRLPAAGYAFRGNRRKYEGEELEYMQQMQKHAHPKMEVLAGGGAILAKTGKRVTKRDAAIAATAAVNPEAAAIAAASNSTAEPEEADDAMESDDDADVPLLDVIVEPANAVDHTRRPIVKATKPAEGRKRANSALKSKRSKA
eukprot:TRINITY_DN9525_c0_g1_i1.p1 TRINITY_DN9525_c0_g1~~TRINITY_DN9525_c0_g1_i1.p1  ORF type:complete len:221 (+),score=75.52 TRINITY_DN9525_c0_g1_i1:79-741(+)